MDSRPIETGRFALALLPLALSACEPVPAPSSASAPAPPSPAPPPPIAQRGDWRDWPLTPGTWRYLPGSPVSSARYGEPGAPQFIVRCDATTRRITLMRAGSSTELDIITSTRRARFRAGRIDENGVRMTAVILNATNRFLDDMAFSRGRIAVESPGLAPLAIPAWAAPARVFEDCRK